MKKHEALFAYQNKKIPFCFWEHEGKQKPDTIIFLGTGQMKRVPYWVAKSAPAGVVVVEGLPHWHSHPSADDIVTFSTEYMKCAFQTILKTYHQTQMNIIGQSQAAPSVLWLANELPKTVGNIALVLPMGLTTQQLGTTNKERYEELKKRSIKSLFHPEQLEPKNMYAGAILARIIIQGHKDGSTQRKYTTGVSHSALDDLSMVLKGNKHAVSLFLGADDVLFPATEIKQSLTEAKITNVHIEIIPKKAHTSLTTKLSSTMVRAAVQAVRST